MQWPEKPSVFIDFVITYEFSGNHQIALSELNIYWHNWRTMLFGDVTNNFCGKFRKWEKHSQEVEAASGGGGPAWQNGLPYFDAASRRWICPDQDEARAIKPSPPEVETHESNPGSDQVDENLLDKVTIQTKIKIWVEDSAWPVKSCLMWIKSGPKLIMMEKNERFWHHKQIS